jgi:hypothetical protein
LIKETAKMRLTECVKTVMRDPMETGALDTATKSVNMANYAKCRILLFITTSGASGDGTVTLKQGTTTTASTALAFAEYWHCENISGDTAADDALTKVAATTLTTAGANTATALYIFEVRADMLDSDTFKSENQYIRLNCTAVTNCTHIACVYELYEPRYARGAESMPSVNS